MKLLHPDRSLRTLRKRLFVFLLLPLAILLVISLTADYRIAFAPANEAFDHSLTDDVVALAGRVHTTSFGYGLEVDLPAAAEAVLRTSRSDKEFLAIFGPNGQLLAGDADLQPDPPHPEDNPSLSDGFMRGHKIRKATYRLETERGTVVTTVAETTHKREKAGSKILAGMILPNILLIVATLTLVYIGVRRGLAPLNQLSEEIARRSPHDLSPLKPKLVPGEVEPLVQAIDILIADLRTAATAQQGFLANAAHQLKTPLAGLQTQLELAAQEIPAEYRHRIVHLRDATQRLGHLAHQLLALARSGPEANLAHEWRRIDLGQMLEASASNWFDRAIARDIDLGFEPVPVIIDGSEWLLRELLANLIDNALLYTPRGGKVTARCGRDDGGRPFIEIEDNGPGIPEEERERIFERFYRAEGATGTGTGLGLAIVKEVATRHRAQIEFANTSPQGGTRFRVSFNASASN